MAGSPTFVIIGGGLAGAKAAEALRSKGFDGQVVLFGAEERLPYERPPLSKEFMAGKKTVEEFTVQPQSWYAEHDVDLKLGTEVTTLDRTAHMVAFNSGDHEHYDKLLLATGSRARKPPIPGSDAHGVYYLRTVDDAKRNGMVLRSPTGRILALDRDRTYAAINYMIQSTAADVLKNAMEALFTGGLGEYLLMPVHDELIAQAPTEDAEDVARAIRETMATKVGEMVLDSDGVVYGFSWGHGPDYHPPGKSALDTPLFTERPF